MNLAEIFIRRPIATTLVMLGIVIFGLLGYQLLPISDLPKVDFPSIVVNANLPGASPETMASSVATPLEKQFSSIAGINSLNSTSSLGSTQVVMQFDLSRDIDSAAQDVESAINAAAGQLPPMPKPPTYRKTNPTAAPILYMYLYSDTLPISDVDEYAEVTVGQPISMVNGVAQVLVFGSQQYAVRVQLNPQELATRGIGLDQVQNAIKQGNVDLPTGSLSGDNQSFTIQANGQLGDAAAYRPLIVSYRNGAPVRLQDLGQVIDSVQSDKIFNTYNGHHSVVLAILRQPGTNTVEIVDTIKKLLPTLRKRVPAAIEMGIMFDRSQSIRASVNDVRFTLLLSICLVVLVIFLFLRNLSATIIPSLALPVSLIGTFAVMYLLGYSLDNLSLMALTLSVGFVVDDAVVMLENIVRHMEMGEGRVEAALNGSREISFTILSMTLSLVAVFIPMLFMPGILGRLFHEFAVTIAVAISVSGFVSLSLTPMLCSRFISPPRHGERAEEARGSQRQKATLYEISERVFDRILQIYEWSLKKVLKYHRTTMIISGVILLLTGYLFVVVPKGFIPTEDTGQIVGITRAAQDISFEEMVRHQQAVADIIRRAPGVESLISNVGASGPNAALNSGRIFLRLKPPSQRRLSSDQIIQHLRPKLAQVPGIQTFLQSPPAIPIGGQQTNGIYQFTLQSTDTQQLYQYVPQLTAKMKSLSGLQDVNTDLQLNSLQLQVEIDRKKASALGITAAQIENTLALAYGSSQISLIYAPNDQFYVILELLPQYQRDPQALSLLYISSSNGQEVPLSTFVKFTSHVGSLTVNHVGQLPSATISFNLAPGTSLSQATQAITQLTSAANLPTSITTSFQGSAQAFKSSLQGLGLLLVVAILVIYLVLGILYENFIHPLTILSGLPSAGFGALLTLLVFHMELDVYSFIGIILLVGIVKKNGIMMVDFAIEAERKEGKRPFDAIYEACVIRFRPIMMTTMAALMGTLPIALGVGAGSESRRPLGVAVVGGLLFSQLLTLYITPVFYTYMEAFREQLSKRRFNRTLVEANLK